MILEFGIDNRIPLVESFQPIDRSAEWSNLDNSQFSRQLRLHSQTPTPTWSAITQIQSPVQAPMVEHQPSQEPKSKPATALCK